MSTFKINKGVVDNLESSLSGKSSTDLDNLSQTGEAHFANSALSNSPYTTNRILEIPQDIKLELNNGTLTLKAGSKLYRPNGFEVDGVTPKFDVVTIANDVVYNTVTTTTGKSLFFLYAGALTIGAFTPPGDGTVSYYFSGPTAPTVTLTYALWYDTANNIVKYTYDNGATWIPGNYLPFSVCSYTTGVGATSIDQIFNGFGYIGSTVFALPGVKVQLVWGRNADGTFHKEGDYYISKKVLTVTRTSGALPCWSLWGDCCGGEIQNLYYIRDFKRVKSLPVSSTTYTKIFNEEDGYYYYTNSGTTPEKSSVGGLPFVSNISCDANGKITSFTPCDVNTVNTYSRSELAGLGMPSSKYENWTLGASGATYIAPANGSFFVRKISSALGQFLAVYYRDSANNPIGRNEWSSAANQTLTCMITVQKGTVVHIDYNAGGATSLFQFIYAEGEN